MLPVDALPAQPSSAQSTNLNTYTHALAGLGALGVALQNYPAVVLFINGLTNGVLPASRCLDWSIQIAALGTGGLCSGMVNFWMNIDLLNAFFKRMTSQGDYTYKKFSAWQKFLYFSGIFVFVVTGILFGLMAFTFAMEGPLAILSIAAGVLVAAIMTIQEVETWLAYVETWLTSDDTPDARVEAPLTHTQLMGKWVGHVIAAGNVLALSLLFTLSLAQGLMALQVAALPALLTGFTAAFTFGAFTEYFFYNVYLSEFCKNFGENWAKMTAIPHAWFGLLCVSTNAFVNGATTYAGVELLTGVLLAAHIALPSLAVITALAAVSAFFAGTASFVLGLDFWIKQNPVTPQATPPVSITATGLSMFPAANETSLKPHPAVQQDIRTLQA